MSNITNIGPFKLILKTGNDYSFIYYQEYIVASAKSNQTFSVGAGIQAVPVDLLLNFVEVFHQANRLLSEARATVKQESQPPTSPTNGAQFDASRTVPSYCVVRDRHRNKPTVGFWTYDPRTDRASYCYISNETDCWVNGNSHPGMVTPSKSAILSDWSVDKPEKFQWEARRRVLINQSVINEMLKNKPCVAYMRDEPHSIFAFLRNKDGDSYSAYHVVKFDDRQANIYLWSIDRVAKLCNLTLISPEEASRRVPSIKWLKAYRKDSTRKYHFFARKFFDNTASNIEVLHNGSWMESSVLPEQVAGEFSDIDWSKKDCPTWSFSDNEIQTLARERERALPYKIVVPKVHINNGLYQFNPVGVAFAERINGTWRTYDGTTGKHSTLDADLTTHSAWVEVQEIPKPIGYREFNVPLNRWSENDAFKLISKWRERQFASDLELRPWYGPSLVD